MTSQITDMKHWSSALAERPSEASCLYLASTVQYPEHIFYYSLLWLQIYHCVQWNSVLFGVMSSFLTHYTNKIHWCVRLPS